MKECEKEKGGEMILLKGRGKPTPEEIGKLAVGNNCEAEIAGERFSCNSKRDRRKAVATVAKKATAGKEIAVDNYCDFGNGGHFRPEAGAIYFNCFGVLVEGVLWGKAEEIALLTEGLNLGLKGAGTEEVAVSAAKKILELLDRYPAVEIKSGPASALMSTDEASQWACLPVEEREGNGDPQRAIIRDLFNGPEKSWFFYSSLFGWVEKKKGEEVKLPSNQSGICPLVPRETKCSLWKICGKFPFCSLDTN